MWLSFLNYNTTHKHFCIIKFTSLLKDICRFYLKIQANSFSTLFVKSSLYIFISLWRIEYSIYIDGAISLIVNHFQHRILWYYYVKSRLLMYVLYLLVMKTKKVSADLSHCCTMPVTYLVLSDLLLLKSNFLGWVMLNVIDCSLNYTREEKASPEGW